jgi:hypothetical protein
LDLAVFLYLVYFPIKSNISNISFWCRGTIN